MCFNVYVCVHVSEEWERECVVRVRRVSEKINVYVCIYDDGRKEVKEREREGVSERGESAAIAEGRWRRHRVEHNSRGVARTRARIAAAAT
jgi:hypothetical protein